MSNMNAKYPLFDFVSESDVVYPFEIDDGIGVSRNDIDVNSIEPSAMSGRERRHISAAEFCLTIDKSKSEPRASSLLFIVSARLTKRSKVMIRYRIDDPAEPLAVLDQYRWIVSTETTPVFDNDEMHLLSQLFRGLRVFGQINTRTKNAVYFLSMAYRSMNWLESLIFHVCALETLTSAPERETGMTDKFAQRIHDFGGFEKRDIKLIYDMRSCLVHGRYECESLEENRRLGNMAEEISRQVFKKVLLCCENVKAFRNDAERIGLFQKSPTARPPSA
jgi:hypothetical protein